VTDQLEVGEQPRQLRDDPTYQVECPTCGARPGQHCREVKATRRRERGPLWRRPLIAKDPQTGKLGPVAHEARRR
jgi:hypothetical protein